MATSSFKISFNWFWQLRMRTQAFIFLNIIFILIALIVIGIYVLHIAIIIPMLEKASIEIYNKQNSISVKNHLNEYEGILDGIFNINIHQLEVVHQIYTQTYNNLNNSNEEIILDWKSHMNYGGTNKIPQILVDLPKGSLDKTHSFMCYTNKSNILYPMDRNTLINLKIQETMYFIGHMMDAQNLNVKSLFYCGLLDQPQVYFAYPCTNFGNIIYNLNIPQRPWFLKGIEIYNNTKFNDYDYQFTSPFLQFTKDKIEVTLVLPLIDKFKQLKGVIASDLGTDLNKFIVKSDENIYMVILADMNGLMIYHSYNVSLELLPIYFYNTSITGFTFEDWNAIIKTQENNCTIFSIYSKQLCRYNSVYDQELIIQIKLIQKYNYVFMIFHDNSDYINYQDEAIEDLLDHLQSDAINTLQISLIVFGLTILFSMAFLIIIFKPIRQLTEHCQNFMGFSQRSKPNQLKKHSLSFQLLAINSQIQQLYLAYKKIITKLNSLSINKGQLCKSIEDRNYPTQIKRYSHQTLQNELERIIYWEMNGEKQRFHPKVYRNRIQNLLKAVLKFFE